MIGAARREESVAAHGARWITVAFMIVGLLNYAYSLMLTRLLECGRVLQLRRWPGPDPVGLDRGHGVRSLGAGPGSGPRPVGRGTGRSHPVLEAGGCRERDRRGRHRRHRSPPVRGLATALVAGREHFVIFLGTTTTGWLQGQQRMRTLSALYVAENMLKNVAGCCWSMVAGLGDNGALAAFGIGALVMLAWWPRTPRGAGGPWRAALADRDLWRRAVRIAGAQGMVSLFVAIDVVLVALLPGDRALAASYQASAALSRVPLFVAGAVAAAFFPSLSRQATGGVIAARALRMYAAVAHAARRRYWLRCPSAHPGDGVPGSVRRGSDAAEVHAP